ncbi:MAG: TetR/AcrR family transcriptional regulator [Sphingomonadales bacterium]|nr:TetR/AcrR family transcriptional regulator [Sphingomonadales bacterium]
MTKKRMPGTERRAQVVAAARRVFSQHGYDGAKTLQIAREANVSEALVYRHFPSKLALYRAVLRQVFSEQDQNWEEVGIRESGAAGIVQALNAFFRACALPTDRIDTLDRHRMTLASLAGDGSYAALIYRRSLRRNQQTVQAANAEARAEGEITGEPLDVNTTSMFVEHVGTMIGAISALPAASRPYGVSDAELARQATWFCCRGLGMSDEVIARHLAGSA